MTLFAFDAGQDWSSTELELLLFIIAPFALAYAAGFGILVIVRGMREKRRQRQE